MDECQSWNQDLPAHDGDQTCRHKQRRRHESMSEIVTGECKAQCAQIYAVKQGAEEQQTKSHLERLAKGVSGCHLSAPSSARPDASAGPDRVASAWEH